MIWNLLIASFGLVAARDIPNAEPEFLDELWATGQDEKLAELLGVHKSFIRPNSSEERSEGSKFNHVSYLGDILLTEEQERQGLRFDKNPNSRWPGGIIPYKIASHFNKKQRKIIQQAIDSLNAQMSNVKLVKRKRQRNYIYVMSGDGCWSYLGKTGGQQALSLQKDGCVDTATVQHEFMHAMGFTHEHNRCDRDEHVTVLWENIPEEWESQYYKEDCNYYWDIDEYDYYSCMHYPMWAPGTGEDAFEVPEYVDGNRLGEGDSCTPTDIDKIDRLYE